MLQNQTNKQALPYMGVLKNALLMLLLLLSSSYAQAQITCQAGFTYSVNGRSVAFYNTSTVQDSLNPNPVSISYTWTLGDGNFNYGHYSYHTYGNFGSYVVSLKIDVTDSIDTCTSTFTDTVQVPLTCNAKYYIYRNYKQAYFYPQTVAHPNQTYLWSFGDGNTSADSHVNHTYADTGTYNTCLIISNSGGCSDTFCQKVIIRDSAICAANFTYTQANDIITFTNSSTTNSGDPLTYDWYFGDGASSRLKDPVHKYSHPGKFTVTLATYDTLGNCSSYKSDSVKITQVCNAGFYYNDSAGLKLAFSPYYSAGVGATYKWYFENGSTSTSANPQFTFSDTGMYTVCLVVRNISTNCVDSICQQVYVKSKYARVCNAAFTFTANYLTVNFSNSSTTASGLPLNYFWDFGDYTPSSNQKNPTHVYAKSGGYRIYLSIYDTVTKCYDSYTDSIFVQGAFCDADFTQSVTGLSATLTPTYHNQANYKYTWSFGDGSSSSSSVANHTYAKKGQYLVYLTVLDTVTGCYDTAYDYVIAMDTTQTTCSAGFTYTANGGQVQFTNISTTSSNFPLIYYWQFGDNNFSYLKNPGYNYNTSGYYSVTLTISDIDSSGYGCQSSFTDTIFISGICNANFSVHGNGLNKTFSHSHEAGNTYQWFFGDGSTSTDSFPTHTFADSGYYNVCMIVSNTQNNCTDTVCGGVYVENNTQAWCNSYFYPQVNFSTVTMVIDTTYAGYNDAIYSWNFGDGTSSTSKKDISHTYSNIDSLNNNFTISLTVTHDSCTSTNTSQVKVYRIPNSNIYGYVYLNGSDSIGAGKAYLIQADVTDTSLSLVDTVELYVNDTSGYASFYFGNKAPGTYYVKAALSDSSPEYLNYLPTYSDTALLWQDAAPLILNGYTTYAIIQMRAGTNPGGPGFIGGKVSEGANKREGDPVKDVQIILFNGSRNPVAYTYSDINGEFKFENLAFGTYEVYTEVPGLVTSSGYATISESNPKQENVEVRISSSGISTSIRTYEKEANISQARIYPNPVQQNLHLAIELRKSQQYVLNVYNITGQVMYSENVNLNAGQQTLQIDTDNLPVGIYMLMLKNASGTNAVQAKFLKN